MNNASRNRTQWLQLAFALDKQPQRPLADHARRLARKPSTAARAQMLPSAQEKKA